MKTTSTFGEYIASQAERVEAALIEALPASWDVPGSLRESMNYSLMAGGKRLRPIMVLEAAEALGGSQAAALPVALAIEMVHTYSLVHDDLPAMDNDDYRRGKLTNHKVYGEAMAILAGDALLTQAFYSVTQAHRGFGIPAERVLAITEELSFYAGARGMVGGQAADMLGEQGITKLEELEFIHLHKTSDLIVFSLRAGGHIAGATEAQLNALTEFGYALGLAFQIQDDILDIIGDEQKLGKPVKSDEKQQKVTYPYFIGLEASEQKVKELTKQAKTALIQANLPNPDRLLQLADYLMQRDH
ncbi:polyprenyl synthetase [Paenibacillus ferrarius]|uniref:Farnesyl diphosphate synthase n=1 Tax=Paenibacillus ferrarius TaxID=1469647 RepID=A0A1V4HQT5_9BACL|nr:farnesyl diphosphate synthase [Paenibacillus ferrarius]OPH60804.1 polyprenyl synthetase [Paenibacillus ferrarius]